MKINCFTKNPITQIHSEQLKVIKRLKWFKENGPCKNCSSDERLEVHHLNPETKQKIRWGWNQKRLDEELSKCIVLCHACHLAETMNQRILRKL